MYDALRFFAEGALFLGYAVIALFFARFWRRTRDRLFGFFALSFGMMAASRLALTLMALPDEAQLAVRLLRLVAFLIILWAIIDKNRRPGAA